MYVGNGMVVHAANSKKGVVDRDFDSYKAYVGFSKIYRP